MLLRASVGTGNIVAARSASFELRTCSPGNERSVLRKRVAAYLWLYTTWLFRRDCLSASRCAICVTKNGQTFWWCARSTVFAVAQRYPGFRLSKETHGRRPFWRVFLSFTASGCSASRFCLTHAGSYLVDPASSHMLVSKIKPCMSKYTTLHSETANGSLNQLWFIRSYNPTWITVVILELIHAKSLRRSWERALLLDQNQSGSQGRLY